MFLNHLARHFHRNRVDTRFQLIHFAVVQSVKLVAGDALRQIPRGFDARRKLPLDVTLCGSQLLRRDAVFVQFV